MSVLLAVSSLCLTHIRRCLSHHCARRLEKLWNFSVRLTIPLRIAAWKVMCMAHCKGVSQFPDPPNELEFTWEYTLQVTGIVDGEGEGEGEK